MLSVTTPRHRLLVCIPGVFGESNSQFTYFNQLIDQTVDQFFDAVRNDAELMEQLERSSSRADAYQSIYKHLVAVTTNQKWLRDCAGADLCRRVLFLLYPDRFGFEKFGWIM